MDDITTSTEFYIRLKNHLSVIYPDADLDALTQKIIATSGVSIDAEAPQQHINHWDQTDVVVITYANSFITDEEKPLQTLYRFLLEHFQNIISIVHILPFFPYTSDDGFAVLDYSKVNESYGDWRDIEQIAQSFKIMADLVINHCSGRSRWFEQLKENKAPGKDYFFCADEEADLSEVVRPRTSPLLRMVETEAGTRHVWCTFSHDQPDLNFQNPEVLLEFIKIIRLYLEKGVKVFRLDAIAFLWKELGTNCINLPQTHEIVRLLRTVIEFHTHDAVIITETNIPNRENLAYFGNSNEAHIIYNFPLPPLLVNTLVTGSCVHLKNWLMSMPPAMMGTTYLNFIASHDGIGLRPAEGLLSDEEISQLVAAMEDFGGEISWRALDDNQNKPYEINITLFDALKGTVKEGADTLQQDRFICAHAIMLALEGIPAFYIHSLLATENDHEKFQNTNNKRAINRHNWSLTEIEEHLGKDTHHRQVLQRLKTLLAIRKQQPAFHPNATQFTLHLGDEIFGIWRQSMDRRQSIFSISNIHNEAQDINLTDINLIDTDHWSDLISNTDISEGQTTLHLQPYQTVWLTNNTHYGKAMDSNL